MNIESIKRSLLGENIETPKNPIYLKYMKEYNVFTKNIENNDYDTVVDLPDTSEGSLYYWLKTYEIILEIANIFNDNYENLLKEQIEIKKNNTKIKYSYISYLDTIGIYNILHIYNIYDNLDGKYIKNKEGKNVKTRNFMLFDGDKFKVYILPNYLSYHTLSYYEKNKININDWERYTFNLLQFIYENYKLWHDQSSVKYMFTHNNWNLNTIFLIQHELTEYFKVRPVCNKTDYLSVTNQKSNVRPLKLNTKKSIVIPTLVDLSKAKLEQINNKDDALLKFANEFKNCLNMMIEIHPAKSTILKNLKTPIDLLSKELKPNNKDKILDTIEYSMKHIFNGTYCDTNSTTYIERIKF